MKEDNFHIDMSGRIYGKKTIGIALVGTNTGINCGCALKGNLLRVIKTKLFGREVYENSAKLYAICIYLLVSNLKIGIKTLIICNDEDFRIVKKVLDFLLKDYDFEIINISEFRKRLGRKVGSFADNYAKIYRRRALKLNHHIKGRKLNVVEVTFNIIEKVWTRLKENET